MLKINGIFGGVISNVNFAFSSADIKIHSGSFETLKEMYPGLQENDDGLTFYGSTSYIGDWTYGGSVKRQYEFTSPVNIFIVYKSGKTNDDYKIVTTHEYGHSLGWAGHASSILAVMYPSGNLTGNLIYVDERHLNQIY